MDATINQITITLSKIPVLQQTADALVNETDTSLRISSDWVSAAGEELVKDALLVGWCDIGSAVMTTAGKLNAKRVIHAVGPRWGDASARGKLANVTWEVLRLANEAGLLSVAMPSISTGTGGYPIENCARVMIDEIIDFSYEQTDALRRVILCLVNDATYDAFQSYLAQSDAVIHPPQDGDTAPIA